MKPPALITIFYTFLVFLSAIQITRSHTYHSIFSFGDSYTDTGNLNVLIRNLSLPLNATKLPYGETFFHHSTGRYSDGRLILDFLAEEFGLPLVPPYLAQKGCFRQGANFAVAGATALDPTFFEQKKRKIRAAGNISVLNTSLNFQIKWFEELKPSLCHSTTGISDCRNYFGRSLFVVGEIGLNDYNYLLLGGMSVTQVQLHVPKVVKTIAKAVQGLIHEGARTVLVPGNVAMGCLPVLLELFQGHENSTSTYYDRDSRSGCDEKLNMLAEYHNSHLLKQVEELRIKYPYARFIYADYYRPLSNFVRFPKRYGFISTPLRVCCGKGGKYNWSAKEVCGMANVSACHDPWKYVSWDGVHLTEAAYHYICRSWLKGPYAHPPILA